MREPIFFKKTFSGGEKGKATFIPRELTPPEELAPGTEGMDRIIITIRKKDKTLMREWYIQELNEEEADTALEWLVDREYFLSNITTMQEERRRR